MPSEDEALPHRGSLGEHPFPGLLHRLHAQRATGTLLLASGKKRKAVQLRDGYPVAVKSNLISECLGNYLVRRGLLTSEDFEESWVRVKRGDGRHGEMLVMMDLLSEDMVSCALTEQAEEKLFEIFEWQEGGFKFKAGARISRGHELALTRSPANLIVEGVRHRVPIELVDRFIALHGEGYVVLPEDSFYRFQEIHLGAKEAEFLCLVNGRRQLGYFRTADSALRRVLYGLISARILDLQATAGVAAINPVSTKNREDGLLLRSDLAEMVEGLRGQSYFEMLGVAEGAPGSAISAAYAKAAGRLHPDQYRSASGATRQLADEAFAILSRANETLLDPGRRREYECKLRRGEARAAEQEEIGTVVAAEIEFRKGELGLRRRNYESALVHLGKALELHAEEGEYHAHYGWCLFLCHQDSEVMIEEAIEHVRRGVKLARDREKPYLFLGRLYKVIGRIRPAEKMFARAVQIRPDCVDALRELRLINMRREKNRSLLSRFFPTRGRDEG